MTRPRRLRRGARWVASLMDRRGTAWAAVPMFLAAPVLLWVAVRGIGRASGVEDTPAVLDPIFFVLMFGSPIGGTWAALTYMCAGLGASRKTAVLVGAGAYLVLGGFVSAFGIESYGIHRGAPMLVLMWPTLWLLLHECEFGIGLWPCPPG